jgi:hypothetical protein
MSMNFGAALQRAGARSLIVAGLALAPLLASADPILSGYGGPRGYGTLALTPNDDGSSSQLNLPFTLNFYGNNYSTFWINNNGNVTFNGPVSNYTPIPFPVSNQPMIAPFWGDVDTRCGTCGGVYVASPNADTAVVTWDNVGYYNSHSNLLNTFQLVLRNRADTGAGNFDVEFRYGSLQWTTGDASGGSGGLGGTPAQAGFDAGDRTNYFTLPGSRTASVLNLQYTSNISPSVSGLWSFAVRSGTPPGSTPGNPILPVIQDGSWLFNFNVGPNSGRVWIDPVVAIGYNYIVDSGPAIRTIVLPAGIGDGIYDLWLFDSLTGTYVNSGIHITGGTVYDFGVGGVTNFSIRGIEVGAGLDPANTAAFVSGLTFEGFGTVGMRMVPLSVNTGAGVPEPSALVLLGVGLCALRFTRRRLALH